MTITLHLKDGGERQVPRTDIAGYWAHLYPDFSETTVQLRDGSEIIVTESTDDINSEIDRLDAAAGLHKFSPRFTPDEIGGRC